MRIYLMHDPRQVTEPRQYVGEAKTERGARQMAADALGVGSLRGLRQAQTDSGICYYAPGGDDYQGANVTIEY